MKIKLKEKNFLLNSHKNYFELNKSKISKSTKKIFDLNYNDSFYNNNNNNILSI